MDRNTLIASLKEDIARGRLVTIAGTGVSVAACGSQEVEGFKVATWTGLLQHGVKHLQDISAANDTTAKVLNLQIESGEIDLIIGAAETISQRMKDKSPGIFRGWLKDTISTLRIEDSAVPDALTALPSVLATLNYDNLLEDATRRHAVTWLKTDEVQDVLRNVATDAILHLHGWFKEPESVVLGLSSYFGVTDHPHTKAVLDLFTLDRTLLLVGCGDTVLDPNFTRLIEWGKEALRDVPPRHYLLCRDSEVADFQKKLADAPWLQPLAYGADYKELAPFLRSLVPAGGAAVAALRRTPARVSFDLAAYQQAMRKRYGRLKLEELDPTTHDVRPLTLTGMFIAQSARECVEFMPRLFELPKEVQRRLREQGKMEGGELDEEWLTQHRRAYLEQSPRPIFEIVHDPDSRRLVIVGDPGSGKPMLLQYLLLKWAEKGAPDLAGEALPLLIELRDYARLRHEGKVDDFLGYLHQGASVRWHLARWHRGAYEETGKGEAKRASLVDAIEHSTAIRQLAGNPLLLTMMAILNRTQDLPRNRAELYEQCAKLLLHQWKVDAAFAPDPELDKASLDYKDKRGLLMGVARSMQSSGRGRNFMLCSVGGRSYAFVHRTFLEYFCAAEIRERFQTEQSLSLEQLKTEIFGHWADETWHEVLSLLAGMLAPKFVREILEWLLARPDPDDHCHHVFLAARCVGEVRRREELGDVEEHVLECTKALIRFNPIRSHKKVDISRISTILDTNSHAVEMAAMIWREDPRTRAWLKARAQSDNNYWVRRSAVGALARGWKGDPAVQTFLKKFNKKR